MNNSVFPIFRKSYITRGMDDRTAKLRAGWRRKGYKSCSRVDSSYGNKLFFPFQKPLPAAASFSLSILQWIAPREPFFSNCNCSRGYRGETNAFFSSSWNEITDLTSTSEFFSRFHWILRVGDCNLADLFFGNWIWMIIFFF